MNKTTEAVQVVRTICISAAIIFLVVIAEDYRKFQLEHEPINAIQVTCVAPDTHTLMPGGLTLGSTGTVSRNFDNSNSDTTSSFPLKNQGR